METSITETITPAGAVQIITLRNSIGAEVRLSTIGAGILSVIVPDRHGNMADVVLGYERIESYLSDGPCAGKIPGRYANRIAAGRFTLDGKEHRLAVNCGPNHLHGGPTGFQNRLWHLVHADTDSVIMTYQSADGEEGYPGNVDVKATYQWSDDCVLTLILEAVTDAPTVINLTNHTYFNLNSHNSGSVLDHELRLNASRILDVDQYLTPLGGLSAVSDTPMDFTKFKKLGTDIDTDFPMLRFGKGYDHCYAIDNFVPGQMTEAAVLRSSKSGRRLIISSDQPGTQLYTGNWLTGSPMGKDGYDYQDYDCVAIECQGMPDAPNHPNFPSQRLDRGETYRRHISYAFSVDM